ncbi:MAG TPA: macro domain-containing protein [Actinospica sp.]|nr:macro domain-containing protein [Actinospica sp.]
MSPLLSVLRQPGQGRRALRLFTGNLLGAFGAASAAIQFFGPVFPSAFAQPGRWTLAAVGPCVAWAAVRARPRARVRREFRYPGMTVIVEPGDLFDRPEHLAVGFSDMFYTEVWPSGPISPESVQGQLLSRVYDGDVAKLDGALAAALRRVRPSVRDRRNRRKAGGSTRYPIGTVAVLDDGPRLVFAVAYSATGADGVARSSVEDLWLGLNRLWDAVDSRGHQEALAIPLLGAGLARLHYLEAQDLLRLILLSFIVRSRERRVCRELRVLIRPEDLNRVDLPSIADFLQSLGAAADR